VSSTSVEKEVSVPDSNRSKRSKSGFSSVNVTFVMSIILAVAYLPLGHLGHAPPLELQKKSRAWQNMQPKCAIFRQKSKKIDVNDFSFAHLTA